MIVGRLIISSSMLSFSSQSSALIHSNLAEHPRKEEHLRRRRRNHRHIRSHSKDLESRFKIPYIPSPFPDEQNKKNQESLPQNELLSLIENSASKEIEIKADAEVLDFSKHHEFIERESELEDLENAGQTHLKHNIESSGTALQRRVKNSLNGVGTSEMLQASLQTSPPDLIETVCLANGACTCAEVTCSLKCTNCSLLNYESMCEELNDPERFS